MRPGPLTPDQIMRYHRDGSLLAPGLFEADEVDLLLRSAREDRALDAHSFGRADGEGGKVRLSLWNHPGEGIYGMFARCRRVVDACEQILDDEGYHYHSKMIMKDARIGGVWTWHQDYAQCLRLISGKAVLFFLTLQVYGIKNPKHLSCYPQVALRGNQIMGSFQDNKASRFREEDHLLSHFV